MKAINARIAQLEKDFEVGCDEIDTRAESQKVELENKLVESITGKIL